MASIKENKKKGAVVSCRFISCLGRDKSAVKTIEQYFAGQIFQEIGFLA